MSNRLTTPSESLTRRKLIAAVLFLSALFLAGCGGGGGGGGTSGGGGTPTPANAAVTGQLVYSGTATPIVGYIVRYGASTGPTATTDAKGNFSITVPTAELSTSATLTILNASGSQIAVQPVNSSANNGSLGTISVAVTGGPPPPPPI